MANYLIYLDSSTQNNKNVSYGASTVAWTIRCNSKTVSRTGLAYSHLNGPNKIIYEGILAAISTLEPENFYAGGSDNVNIYVDSQVVINQLNGSFVAKKMMNHLLLVKEKCAKHPNVKFNFLYKSEKEKEFKEVDTLSKNGRHWFPKVLKSLKK